MHKHERERKIHGRGGAGSGKAIVAGTLKRSEDGENSQVQAAVVPRTDKSVLHSHVRSTVEPGASLYTDAHTGYSGLDRDYDHAVVDHAEEYVQGRVHTNGMENFWALLKRGTARHLRERSA